MNKSIVGQSYPRLESVSKVIGAAKYTDDFSLPNMAYCMLLRSPYPHAKVLQVDTTKAEKIPGVLRILLPEDVPSKKYNNAVITESPVFIEDQSILTARPVCMGDRIAAVAASSKEACQKALDALVVEYESLPSVFETDEALRDTMPPLHPSIRDSNVLFRLDKKRGDVELGFAESDAVFEDTFLMPSIQHVSLEPNSCICDYELDGKLNIISTSQSPFKDKRLLSRLLGMRENDIRITKPIMGGGFGERQQIHNQPIASLLSMALHRPVKCINSREEQMYGSTVRHSAKVKLKIGVKNDGTIHAFHMDIDFNGGAYANVSFVVLAIGLSFMNYNTPHFLCEGRSIYTNLTPGGAMRGFGNPQAVFPREVMLERIAHAMHMDSVAFRLKNHLHANECIPGTEKPISSSAIEACAREAEEIKQNIEKAEKAEQAHILEKNPYLKEGWGVAFACHPSSAGTKADASGTIILVNSDGTVQLVTGSADIGQGSNTALCQLAAQELGLDMEDVTIMAADTAFTPYDTGTYASSQAFRAGNAVLLAAQEVKRKVKQRLAKVFEVGEEEIPYQDGRFTVQTPQGMQAFTLKEAMVRLTYETAYEIIIGVSEHKTMEDPLGFVVCWANVVVDARTNCVHLKHIIQALDIGKAINPKIVEGQVQGAIAMAVGYTMTEQIETDKRMKKILSSDLLHYNAPLSMDMPQIHVRIVDGYEPKGPFGAKSVGELPINPVAPAIVNAICNATGATITQIPITHAYYPKGTPFA